MLQTPASGQPAAYDNFIMTIFAISSFGLPPLMSGDFAVGQVTPRLVITEPDGTVIFDSSKPTDLSVTSDTPGTNSYFTWQAKHINENLNTRMAIMTAQMFPCGVGYETKFSSTTQTNQASVAIRAGQFTNNTGTFRYSKNV